MRRRRDALAVGSTAVAATVTVAFLVLPLAALVVRAPWSAAGDLLGEPAVRTALRLSLVCSLSATALAVVLGTPLAWVLARVPFPGRGIVRTVTTLSMVLPPVVSGVALLLAFGRRGLVGQWLDRWFGIQLPFTTWGVVVAQTFVAMPFLVLTLEGALRTTDRQLEDAAATLGASRWYTFRRITLPAVGPSLGAGAVLAGARALGEFGATITFAGSFPGTTQTLPLGVYRALQTDLDTAVLLSLVLVGASLAVLASLRGRWLGALSTRP